MFDNQNMRGRIMYHEQDLTMMMQDRVITISGLLVVIHYLVHKVTYFKSTLSSICLQASYEGKTTFLDFEKVDRENANECKFFEGLHDI